MSIAKRVILEELENNNHIEKVEDVIVWSLEFYYKNNKTNGALVANSIVTDIKLKEQQAYN